MGKNPLTFVAEGQQEDNQAAGNAGKPGANSCMCSSCAGTGKCAECEGAGKIMGRMPCLACKVGRTGNGKCRECKGTGSSGSMALEGPTPVAPEADQEDRRLRPVSHSFLDQDQEHNAQEREPALPAMPTIAADGASGPSGDAKHQQERPDSRPDYRSIDSIVEGAVVANTSESDESADDANFSMDDVVDSRLAPGFQSDSLDIAAAAPAEATAGAAFAQPANAPAVIASGAVVDSGVAPGTPAQNDGAGEAFTEEVSQNALVVDPGGDTAKDTFDSDDAQESAEDSAGAACDPSAAKVASSNPPQRLVSPPQLRTVLKSCPVCCNNPCVCSSFQGESHFACAQQVAEATSDLDRLFATLDEAAALFESGDFIEAERGAVRAAAMAAACSQSSIPSHVQSYNEEHSSCYGSGSADDTDHAASKSQTTESSGLAKEHNNAVGADGYIDYWAESLGSLALAYDEVGNTKRAEALYLRMLAWREGAEQFKAGNFSASCHLSKQSPSFGSIEDATWFLGDLRPDDAHAVPQVVALLALSEEVASKASVALWTLALRPAHRPLITECGGLELMAKAVSLHPNSAELQAAGCGALKLLCQGHDMAPRNRVALIARLGGADAITRSMQKHPYDAEVQREACGAFRAAAVGNPNGARKIVESGAASLILEAVHTCPRESVGEAAAKALATLFSGGGNVHQANSKSGKEGGHGDASPSRARGGNFTVPSAEVARWSAELRTVRERVLLRCSELLQEHLKSGDTVVVPAILTAIAVLLEDNGVRDLNVSLVPIIISAMQRFPGHMRVQAPACGCLWRLTAGHSGEEKACVSLSRGGGIAPICQAMRDLPLDPKLQHAACGALRNVAKGDDGHKTFVVRAGGVPAVVEAMRRHSRDADLQEAAIGALTNLCDTVGRAALCARLGGVEAVVSALKRHMSVQRLAELACALLCMFCDEEQIRQQILRAGAVDIAKALSRKGVSEAQRWGCELLRDLSRESNK